MTLAQLLKKFPDNATAEQWFIDTRWPNGIRCPKCDSDNIQERATRKPQPTVAGPAARISPSRQGH